MDQQVGKQSLRFTKAPFILESASMGGWLWEKQE